MGTRFRPLAFEQEACYVDEDLKDSLVAAMRSGTMPLSTQAAPGHQGTEGPLLCLLLFLALPHACPVLFNPLSHLGGVHGGTVGGGWPGRPSPSAGRSPEHQPAPLSRMWMNTRINCIFQLMWVLRTGLVP